MQTSFHAWHLMWKRKKQDKDVPTKHYRFQHEAKWFCSQLHRGNILKSTRVSTEMMSDDGKDHLMWKTREGKRGGSVKVCSFRFLRMSVSTGTTT